MNVKRINVLLAGLLFLVGAVRAENSKGVFSVSATKTVQFKMENETRAGTYDLFKWREYKDYNNNGWRVLTSEEWSYLLASGRPNAANLNSLGTINGENVLIILPDGWVKPDGVNDFSTDYMSEGFGANTYNTSTWALMAESGAVFLPCGGYSADGTVLVEPHDHGAYWSSNVASGSNGYCIRFNDDNIHDQNSQDTTLYYSIRLVREVPILDEADEQSAFDTKIALAKTQDIAFLRRILYKDGYFNTLCLPFDVPSIAASPLAGAEVYTFESGEVVDDVLQLNLELVTGDALAKGVPYLIRWASGDDLSFIRFDGLSSSSWDDDDAAGDDPGSSAVKYHGFYYKTHIDDDNDGADTHYNFFLGANDVIYWPTDGGDPDAKMSGFRAHFYIAPSGSPSHAPVYRGMPAAFRIKSVATGVDEAELVNKAQKLLREGRVVIVVNGESYTIGGQKL